MIIPGSYILYEASQRNAADEEPWLTQLLHKFDYLQEQNQERNALHAKLAEQAAADRILFGYSDLPSVRRRVPVNSIEQINQYCPHNVQPGWGSIRLDKLVEHVNKENDEIDQQNLERFRKRIEEERSGKKD